MTSNIPSDVGIKASIQEDRATISAMDPTKALVMWLVMTASAQDPAPAHGEKPRVLCGRKLADTRMLYCLSTKPDQKRSNEIPLLWRMYNEDDNDMPWLTQQSQERALALAARGKRTPGLVDECCFKPCYLSELLNYC